MKFFRYFIIETQLSKNYMLRFGKIEIGILLLCIVMSHTSGPQRL